MISSLPDQLSALSLGASLGCCLLAAVPVGLAGQERVAPRRAPDVHFIPTEMGMVRTMLEVAKVGKEDLVYDLGCGDGRIVITAVKRYGARGVCVDIDPERIKESRIKADSAGVAHRITFREGDLFEMDLREATVVTLYLLPALNERLRPKLFRELRPGSRVVSNSFDMGDWKPDSVLQASPRAQLYNFAYYWVIPVDVAGTWQVTVGSTNQSSMPTYTLKLEQRYQHATGTASAGAREVSLDEVSLRGDRLNFVITDTLGGKTTTLRFTGRVIEGRAEGTLKGSDRSRSWTAKRTERGPRPELGLL